MRYVLILTAIILAGLTAIQYVGEPPERSPFRNSRIVVLAGGREEDVFMREVSLGAFQAARDLGCEVEVLRTQWNVQEQIGVFQQVMAGVPDAICVVGSADIESLRPMIDDAIQEGISITSYYRRAPSIKAAHASQGFGYAGPDADRAAEDLLRAAVAKHGLAAGDRVLLSADPRLESGSDVLEAARKAATALGLAPEVLDVETGD
jgi:simple sugar transport system substrate-binding protein